MNSSKKSNRAVYIEQDDYAMYILINNDLGMEKGKIAAQAGHVVQHIIEKIVFNHYQSKNDESLRIKADYIEWKKHHGSAKIILKASQRDIENLMSLPNATYVMDAGRTQVDAGSLTALGFYPGKKKDMEEIMRRLKLL